MKELPIRQVGKVKGGRCRVLLSQMQKLCKLIKSGQTILKSSEGMRTFSRQTKRVEQFVKNALNALAQVSQPPSPLFGPLPLSFTPNV